METKKTEIKSVRSVLDYAKCKVVSVKDQLLKLAGSASSSSSSVVTLKEGEPFASQVTKEDIIYVVKHAFDLGGETVELPKRCTLEFKGGKLTNGTLIGRDGIIRADRRIFDGVAVEGTWSCVGNAGWWAAGNDIINNQWGWVFADYKDQSVDLQLALDSAFREVHFPPKCYYLDKPLVLTKEKKLVMHGSDMKLNIGQTGIGKLNTAVIFSDKDICLLRIAVNENKQNAVVVEGGSFDVSRAACYTQNCIEVRADEEGQRLWGLTLNTNVKGKFGSTTGVGININPVENKELTGNKAYVTQVRINSNVSNFGTGVKAMNYMDGSTCQYYNWCTDMVVDGSIINCPTAVDTNDEDTAIRATEQSGKFWNKKENGAALIKYSGPRASVSGSIYDIRMKSGEGWSNEYALEVTDRSATVTADGKFRAFCAACKKLGWPVVNGEVII